jgi:hypothetical protein
MPTRIADKMGIREGERLFIANAPPESIKVIDLPSVEIKTKLLGTFDHMLVFVKTQAEMNSRFPDLKTHLAPTAKLWITWPKRGLLGTDLNLKQVIRIGYDHGLVESNNIRIDDTWTTLKFTWPKAHKTYNNKYGKLRR